MCIFESDTVKNDCPMQDFKISKYRLLVSYTSLSVCSGDIKKRSENEKKKALKMTSQLVIFRAFISFFSVPLTLNLKKNPVNQLIKKIWPICLSLYSFSWKSIVDYIDSQFETYLAEEMKIKRSLFNYHDGRIHACLYFIAPTGHS